MLSLIVLPINFILFQKLVDSFSNGAFAILAMVSLAASTAYCLAALYQEGARHQEKQGLTKPMPGSARKKKASNFAAYGLMFMMLCFCLMGAAWMAGEASNNHSTPPPQKEGAPARHSGASEPASQ